MLGPLFATAGTQQGQREKQERAQRGGATQTPPDRSGIAAQGGGSPGDRRDKTATRMTRPGKQGEDEQQDGNDPDQQVGIEQGHGQGKVRRRERCRTKPSSRSPAPIRSGRAKRSC